MTDEVQVDLPKCYFVTNSRAAFGAMQEAFAGVDGLRAKLLHYVTDVKDLDAVYLSVLAAERYGVIGEPYKAEIVDLRGRPNKEPGLPAFIVSGGLLQARDDPFAISSMRMTFEAVLREVSLHNSRGMASIKRLGLLADYFLDSREQGGLYERAVILAHVYKKIEGPGQHN